MPIYDSSIVSMRQHKSTPQGQSLWNYANLYFQPRNPMMYRVICEQDKQNLAVIGIKPAVLESADGFVTDGNAANNETQFFPVDTGLKMLKQQWKIIESDWWKREDGSKRKIMSECLVPERIRPELIHSIYVANDSAQQNVERVLGGTKIPIVRDSHMFFQPRQKYSIGQNISVIDGDMFFSSMQTLTISVNLQGVMGKGLASRTKYQFPDVYVDYQDACRKKQLTVATPYLYKREVSLDQQLADLTSPLSTPNAIKWFLLFATKRKWRENSRLEDMESGLSWIRDHYKQVGIKSLALPALGCGLGNLGWEEVGPLMCQYLHGIDIHVAIYLPREDQIDRHYLTADYLLKDAE